MKTIELNFNTNQTIIIQTTLLAIAITLINAIATEPFFFIGALLGATLSTLIGKGLNILLIKFAKKAA